MPNDALNLTDKSVSSTAQLESVCVYCGSGGGRNPAYMAAAATLGTSLGEQGVRLVYGGGNLGLMGAVARAARDSGGLVTGIIPDFLSQREQQISEIDELIVVKNMHDRKMLMFQRADAFVALPGGIGTLEELVEQLTWAQLGQHNKPVVLANIEGFWSPFLSLLEHMREETFIRDGLDVNFSVADDIEHILPIISQKISERPEPVRDTTVIEKF
ncbi:MAG: TIGR00730 family Rossman fold protein [Hyphomicrobiaceae bacterium]